MGLTPWLTPIHERLIGLQHSQGLSHAMLLMGADGVGQDVLAEQLAIDLMCEQAASACGECHSCQLMQAHSHPDYHFVDGRAESIKVDRIRGLIKQVSQKAQVGRTKVLSLCCAQSMNTNAANALLKILEEPPAGCYFILTATEAANLLPTVKSRCLLVNVPTPEPAQVAAWLTTEHPNENLSDLFWLTTQPYRLAEIAGTGKAAFYREIPNELQSCLDNNAHVSVFLKGVDSKNVVDYIQGLQAICHQCLLYSTGTSVSVQQEVLFQRLLSQLGIHRLLEAYRALQLLKDNLGRTNLNAPIQLKSEFNKWFR